MILGNPQANICVYLPHQPEVPENWDWQHPAALTELLACNSNHWRKIWVISAKIVTAQDDWRSLMEHELLNLCCFYCDEKVINLAAQLHLFSGKAISQRYYPANNAIANLAPRTLYQHPKDHWHLPYFDYRQFPNLLIAELTKQIATAG